MSDTDDYWLDYLTEGEARSLLQELWMARRETINGYGEAAGRLTLDFMDTQHKAMLRLHEAGTERAAELVDMFPDISDTLDEFIADVFASKASDLNNAEDEAKLAFLLSHMETVENVAKEMEVDT